MEQYGCKLHNLDAIAGCNIIESGNIVEKGSSATECQEGKQNKSAISDEGA